MILNQFRQRMEQEVIKIDVIASRDADFLATHVPFRGLRYYSSNQVLVGSDYSEDRIYREFILNPEALHQFIIIKGPNGAGKSHLIRWLKVRQEMDVEQFDINNNVVVFIKRSENTLSGTVRQLLEAGIIQDEEMKKTYKQVADAQVTMPVEKLKATLLYHFVAAVQYDEGDKLSPKDKKQLAAFLGDQEVGLRLLATDGPIHAICGKVISIPDSKASREPRFELTDFLVDMAFLKRLDANASKETRNLAARLYDDNDRRELHKRLADFLNSQLDQVVSYCAKIQAGDLRRMFIALRKELKGQGKSLTLYIEDITAFTGIDKELVDCLVVEHGGMYEELEVCPLVAVVGITDNYYNQFRDNFKDRVTAEFEVAENVFDQNSICEMASRYLNAIYQPYSSLESWASHDAQPEHMPTAPLPTSEPWEYVELTSGQRLTLFPFTTRALEKLYGELIRKTPRNFLRLILRNQLKNYFDSPTQFPLPSSIPGTLVIWKEPTHQVTLSNQGFDEAVYERLKVLLCVWGEGHLWKGQTTEGTITTGGLPSAVFRAFGLPEPVGIPKQGDASAFVPKPKPGGIGPTPLPPAPTRPTTSREEREYTQLLAAIDSWERGNPLRTFEKLRDMLGDYLITAINWQSEGVSYFAANSMIRRNTIVSIEDQQLTGQSIRPGIAVLPRGLEGKMILQGLAMWDYLGKRSWAFDQAHYYQYVLYCWTMRIKSKIVSALTNPSSTSDWPLYSWACALEYYRLLLMGNIDGTEDGVTLLEKLLSIEVVKPVSSDNGHCQSWTDMLSNIGNNIEDYKHNKILLRQFYNTRQGDVTGQFSNKFFLHTADITNCIEQLLRNNWGLNLSGIQSGDTALQIPLRQLKHLLEYKDKIAADEVKEYKDLVNVISNVAKVGSVSEVRELVKLIKRFLTALNDANYVFSPEINNQVQYLSDNADLIVSAWDAGKRLENLENTVMTIQAFSRDPICQLRKVSSLLATINNLVDKYVPLVEAEITARRSELPDTSSETQAIVQKVNQLRDSLDTFEEGLNNAG